MPCPSALYQTFPSPFGERPATGDPSGCLCQTPSFQLLGRTRLKFKEGVELRFSGYPYFELLVESEKENTFRFVWLCQDPAEPLRGAQHCEAAGRCPRSAVEDSQPRSALGTRPTGARDPVAVQKPCVQRDREFVAEAWEAFLRAQCIT